MDSSTTNYWTSVKFVQARRHCGNTSISLFICIYLYVYQNYVVIVYLINSCKKIVEELSIFAQCFHFITLDLCQNSLHGCWMAPLKLIREVWNPGLPGWLEILIPSTKNSDIQHASHSQPWRNWRLWSFIIACTRPRECHLGSTWAALVWQENTRKSETNISWYS